MDTFVYNMKRKLVSQGRATLTISLPSKWLKTFGLKAGDEVEIGEKGAELILKTEKGVTIEKTEVNVQDFGEKLIVRMLANLYRKGYDEIEIQLETAAQLEQIQAAIQRSLLGFEIVRHGQRSCTIKNISGPMEGEFDSMLRRVFLLLKSMAFDGLTAIKTKNTESLKNLILNEKINNRLTTICRRIINKKGFEKNSTFIYGFVNYLEKIADEYRDLYKYILDKKPKITTTELKLMEAANENLNRLYENYYKFERQKVMKIFGEVKRIRTELNKELENKKANAKIVHHLYAITDLTENCLSLTFGLKL